MDCDTCREALSARMDGEPAPVPPDEHLAACRACQDWLAAATALTRELEDVPPGPDLTASVLDRVEPRTGLLGTTRWRPHRMP